MQAAFRCPNPPVAVVHFLQSPRSPFAMKPFSRHVFLQSHAATDAAQILVRPSWMPLTSAAAPHQYVLCHKGPESSTATVANSLGRVSNGKTMRAVRTDDTVSKQMHGSDTVTEQTNGMQAWRGMLGTALQEAQASRPSLPNAKVSPSALPVAASPEHCNTPCCWSSAVFPAVDSMPCATLPAECSAPLLLQCIFSRC